jgi:hypothetical protein
MLLTVTHKKSEHARTFFWNYFSGCMNTGRLCIQVWWISLKGGRAAMRDFTLDNPMSLGYDRLDGFDPV